MDKNIFKNTCIFAVCGIICITLLGISTMSLAKSMYTSDTDILNIELDDSLYKNLLSLSPSSDSQDSSNMDNLYVIINGKEYPVIRNEDGQLAVQDVRPDNSFTATADMPPADAAESPRYTFDANGNRVYHIIWGDTLSELALEFDSSINELASYNHISDPDLIYAEDSLYLPDK